MDRQFPGPVHSVQLWASKECSTYLWDIYLFLPPILRTETAFPLNITLRVSVDISVYLLSTISFDVINDQ